MVLTGCDFLAGRLWGTIARSSQSKVFVRRAAEEEVLKEMGFWHLLFGPFQMLVEDGSSCCSQAAPLAAGGR